MFVVIMATIFALIGTMISLRFTWLDKLEGNNTLTRRGRITFSLAIGLGVFIMLVLMNGMWWNCDGAVCSWTWRI